MEAHVRRALRLGWVPLAASLLALVLSVASIWISTREPEVVVLMPDVVRLAGGHATGASYAYLQPAFVSTGVNDRVEVISDMSLAVAPETSPDEPSTFEWREQIQLVADDAGVLGYRHEADAVPLLISPKAAAAPIALFQAPQGWFFGAGRYRFELVAERLVAGSPLRARFAVTVTPDDLAVLDAPGPERFLAFRLEPA